MKRHKNPFPGVGNMPSVDRHGVKRWRLRKTVKGRKIDIYMPGAYGSAEFRNAYDLAINPPTSAKPTKAEAGTFDHVIELLLQHRDFKGMTASTRYSKRNRLDWIRGLVGKAKLADFEPYHIENLMDRKGGPWAADRLHKDITQIYKYATQKLGFNGLHPTEKVQRNNAKTTGHHTWTAEQVEQFRQYHVSGTQPRLALEVFLGTGAARQDACTMSRANIKGPHIWYRRGKTGQDVTLPLNYLPELQSELQQLRHKQVMFFTHGDDKPYTVESFGNWFADQCDDAGLLSDCRAHGLRKHGATRLAERGASEFQIMAFLAHKTPYEARRYVQAANRVTLAANALALLPVNNLTNLNDELGKTTNQVTVKKGK